MKLLLEDVGIALSGLGRSGLVLSDHVLSCDEVSQADCESDIPGVNNLRTKKDSLLLSPYHTLRGPNTEERDKKTTPFRNEFRATNGERTTSGQRTSCND